MWIPLLLLLCGFSALVRPLAAQPACPISGPNTTLTAGSNIGLSGSRVVILSTAGNYTVGASGVGSVDVTGTICIIALAPDQASTKVLVSGATTHFILLSGGTLYLENLVVEGVSGTSPKGGLKTAAGGSGNRTLLTNKVAWTKYAPLDIFQAPFVGRLHDNTFQDHVRTQPTDAAAVNVGHSAGAASLTFTGTTRFLDNLAVLETTTNDTKRGGAMQLAPSGSATSNILFDGSTEFRGNKAMLGGAVFVTGATTLRFQGSLVEFHDNEAVGNSKFSAFGGALMTGAGADGITTIEFASAYTTLHNNIARASTGSSGGAAMWLDANGAGHTVRVSFLGPAYIGRNVATPASAVSSIFFNGALVLWHPGTSVNVQRCLTFEDNVILLNNASKIFGNDAAAMEISSAVTVNSTAQLKFSNNTIVNGSSSVEVDVWVFGSGTVQCGSGGVKGAGGYVVQCDLCAANSDCSPLTTGGSCNACNVSSSVCPADCTSQPSNVSNAAPWSCPSLLGGSVCNTTCNAPSFVPDGPAVTATCTGGTWTVSGNCVAANCTSQPNNVSNAAPWSCPSLLPGSVCNTTCNAPAFVPVGPAVSATCTGGTWNVSVSCVPANCSSQPIPNVTNAAAWSCPSLLPNATCTTTCNAGFVGSPQSPVARCTAGSWAITGGCAGCPPPPTGGATGFTNSTSCSPGPSSGSFPIGAVCLATCAAASSGGFARCRGPSSAGGAPGWDVTACNADCVGNPPSIQGAVWQCPPSTIAGGSCRAACSAPGFDARDTVTATCVGGAWSSATSGSCTRVACVGPPPGPPPPNATFQCTSTPVGQPCRAVCAPGLTAGSAPSRVCLANGTFGPLEGGPCVDCTANQPRLDVLGPPTSVPAGSTAVSAQFVFTALLVTGTSTLAATLDGLPAQCTTNPAQLTGAATAGVQITVTCQRASGLSAGFHKIRLTVTFQGSNGCSGGELTALADVLAEVQPVAAPRVELAPATAVAPPACKAAAGKHTAVTAVFRYQVTPAAGATGVPQLQVSASAAGATCNSTRPGSSEEGAVTVTCRGVFDGLSSLIVNATLKASTSNSLVGSATSSQAVALACCSPAHTVARAVNASSTGSSCRTCGSAGAVEAVLLQGGLESGVLRSGAISNATCSSSGADVGVISASCDATDSRLLHVAVSLAPGSSATLQYITRCNVPVPPGSACYAWTTANKRRNDLHVSTSVDGRMTLSFGVRLTPSQASCVCSDVFWAVKATGSFELGPVSAGGTCP